MGRKKSGKKALSTSLPWCWYCDREFESEKVLIDHQKAKHFKCTNCNKKLSSVNGLSVHMDTVHKEKLYKIPNAMEGRDSVEFEIFGMEGIPQEDLIARSQPDQREVKRMAMDPEYSAIPSAIPVPYPVTFPQLMIQPAYPPPPTHTVPVVNTYSNGFQQPSTAFASPPSQIPLVTSIDTLYPQVQYPPPATLPSETISTTKTSSTSQDKPVRREQKLVYNIDTDDLSIEERRSKLKMYRWIH